MATNRTPSFRSNGVLTTATRPYSPNLARLPLDTLIHILSFLYPRDIISLRMSSKTLSAATKLRTVWVNALRVACYETQIFEGTYLMKTMTVSELEYAVSRHHRFLSLLWNNMLPLIPVSIRILQLYPPIPPVADRPFGHFTSSTIVPGGRFLITATSAEIVQLWDLGFAPRVFLNPCPLASLFASGLDDNYDILVQPSPDGQAVRLLLVLDLVDETQFSVYEIYPTSETPSFRLLASLKYITADIDAYIVVGDRFAFHGLHDVVVVWDFIHDKAIRWEYVETLSDIMFSDDDLICAGVNEYAIFRIPPLEDHIAGVVDLGPQTPILRLACTLGDSAVSSHNIWRPGATRIEYFDAIGEEADGSVTVSRYVLKPIANHPSDGLPRNIPVLVDCFKHQPVQCNRMRYISWKLAYNSRLLSWVNEMAVHVHLSTTASGTGDHGKDMRSISGVLWRWPDAEVLQEDRHHAFCPISGRLCVSSWDHEIRILDYIMPPL